MSSGGDQKLQVQQATDLVRLIGEEVSLRPKGKEFVGLCPFHDDKKPSMHVSPVKQIYKCFSCGAGGDAFSFVMNYHKMTFPEALGYLAERAGIKLESYSRSGSGGQKSDERELVTLATQQAAGFFRSLFNHPEHGEAVREYVSGRGINQAMVEAFGMGYAPDRWDGLVEMIQHKGWGDKGFALAGLIGKKKSGGGWYDRFRNRLMFPIFDGLGRPIAFGARRLDEQEEPKYLNSPESMLFNKSETLYGLHLAKKPIIDLRVAVVVEGYTDVIACHQAGIQNVVATLGTAFTREHEAVLSRLCDRVVLLFDADGAGQKAADRAVEIFLKGALDVGVAVLPPGLDPAQMLGEGEEGRVRFRDAIEQAVDALDYKFSRMNDELSSSVTLTGRERVARRYLQDLTDLGVMGQGAIRRAMIVGKLAQILGVSQRAVEEELKQVVKARDPAAVNLETLQDKGLLEPSKPSENYLGQGVALTDRAHKIRALGLAERYVIGCLLRRPALFHLPLSQGTTLDTALTPKEFITPVAKRLYQRVYDRLSGDDSLTLGGVLADLAFHEEHDLVRLATDAEIEAETRSGDDEERLSAILTESAESILGYHREQQYLLKRRAAFQGGSDQDPQVMDQAQLMRELVEHRRQNPSAVRIARLEASP